MENYGAPYGRRIKKHTAGAPQPAPHNKIRWATTTRLHKKEQPEWTALSVRGVGLEPTRLSPPDPKSGAATNYAISA